MIHSIFRTNQEIFPEIIIKLSRIHTTWWWWCEGMSRASSGWRIVKLFKLSSSTSATLPSLSLYDVTFFSIVSHCVVSFLSSPSKDFSISHPFSLHIHHKYTRERSNKSKFWAHNTVDEKQHKNLRFLFFTSPGRSFFNNNFFVSILFHIFSLVVFLFRCFPRLLLG